MIRIAHSLFFIVLACGAAGLFGALHDQVSYAVSPAYFHHLKFNQFGIPDALHDWRGAALVGVLASWWMGLLIGTPLALLALLFPDADQARQSLGLCILVTIGVTVLSGTVALLAGPPFAALDQIRFPAGIPSEDHAAFAHVGQIHAASYLGGALGLLISLVVLGLRIVRARAQQRRTPSTS